MKTINLSIVIVTYNRLEKLKKALSLYNSQTMAFKSLIIVDNCSTDGTINFLKEWKKKQENYDKYVILLPSNQGGSGGFYEGQKYALTLNPDWVYVADDDAYPEKNMVESFYNIITQNTNSKIAAICAAVHNIDHSIAYSHRSNYHIKNGYKFIRIDSKDSDYSKPKFSIKLLSYVASFINANALRTVGLCNPNYFIYNDDTEHSIRLSRYGSILCYPSIIIIHDNALVETTNNKPIITYWKDFYSTRNNIHMIKQSHKIAALHITFKYLYWSFISFIKSFGNKKEKYYYKLTLTAITNAWLNKLGKHNQYEPGFVIYK